MQAVEILPVQETIVLRARGSELLILPHHVRKLKGMTKPKDFSSYFHSEALVNRPARKLFEAWLRHDTKLWSRLYTVIHKEMEFKPEGEGEGDDAPAKADKAVKKEAKADKPAKKEAKAEAKPEKKDAKAEAKAEKPVKKDAKAEAKADKPAKKDAKAEAKADKPAKKDAKGDKPAKKKG